MRPHIKLDIVMLNSDKRFTLSKTNCRATLCRDFNVKFMLVIAIIL